MPRNSAGVYSLPELPFVPQTVISSSAVNDDFDDIADALTDSLSRSGAGGMLSNLAMGGFKVTGMAAGTNPGDALAVSQVPVLLDSIAALRAFTVTVAGVTQTVAQTLGYTARGDGGGNIFYWDAASTATDNGGTIIKATAITTGRWLALNAEVYNVAQFGALADGNDDTTGASAAYTAVIAANGGAVWWPPGTYLLTGPLPTISVNHIYTYGAGQGISTINFVPTAGDQAVFTVDRGSAVYFNGAIKSLSFTSTDTTFKKYAIKLIDCSGYELHDIGTIDPHWFGAGSTFVSIQGRELGSMRDWYVAADQPLFIGPIPAPHVPAGIGLDQHNFHNIYLIGETTAPIILVDNGTLMTQVSFTGYQSWVGGGAGFFWHDTINTAVSNGVSFDNVRLEQGLNAAAYCFDISLNAALQGLTITRGEGGGDRNGIKLRTVDNATFIGWWHVGASNVALDVDTTVRRVEGQNCFWQQGSTSSLNGQRYTYATPQNPSNAALPPSFHLDQTANTLISSTIGPSIYGGVPYTLNNNTEVDLPYTLGLLTIVSSDDSTALIAFKGDVHGTVIVSDWAGLYSTVSGTSGKTNVYYNSGSNVYRLQNQCGAVRSYGVTFSGGPSGS